MLTNEPGYVFVVQTEDNRIAGIFYRYGSALEGVRMSIDSENNPELEERKGDCEIQPSVGIWVENKYICSIEKIPIMKVAVGMSEILR